MHQNELEIGDLIFYVSPTLGIIEHTTIYLGEKEGIPYVLHATKDRYKAVMVTYLKNTIDADFKYHVVRPTDASLAMEALVILLRWVEYQVPYASREKIERLMTEAEKQFSMELKSSARQQAEFGKKSYRANYSQYLTMANALPYVVEKHGIAEGLGCAETIVSAFNLALLMRHATQEILSDERTSWNIGDFPLDDFVDTLHNPLPFDAKFSLSAGIYEHCINTPENWLNMGELQSQAAAEPGEEAKEIWRTFNEALKKRSSYLVERRRSLSDASPGKARHALFSSSPNLLNVIAYASLDDQLSEFGNESDESIEALVSDIGNQRRTRSRTLSLESPIASFFLHPPKQSRPEIFSPTFNGQAPS